MLHACVQRFDVTGNLEKFYKILGTKQALKTYAKETKGVFSSRKFLVSGTVAFFFVLFGNYCSIMD
jgi:hypothetical protein